MKEDKLWVSCTGDACVGDYVEFEKAIFSGSYPRAKFIGTELISGTIVSDSYGEKKQQHTFTIEDDKGYKFKIKGRNLYRNGCKRLLWADEEEREKILKDKHYRGSLARAQREKRISIDY